MPGQPGAFAASASEFGDLVRIPGDSPVSHAFVEAYNHPFGLRDLSSGKLDGDAAAEVLALISQFGSFARLDQFPRHTDELGSVRFVDKDGISRRICWYFVGDKGRLRLSIGSVLAVASSRTFQGEESLVLDARIRGLLEHKVQGSQHQSINGRMCPRLQEERDLSALLTSLQRSAIAEQLTMDLRNRWGDQLRRIDPTLTANQGMISATREFLSGRASARTFIPYIEDELSRRNDTESQSPGNSIVNSLDMKLAYIPPREFEMGSRDDESPRGHDEHLHSVKVTRGFYLGAYEVTQDEYSQVMGKNPSWFSAGASGALEVKGLDTRRFPVESVSWEFAVDFCRRLSELPAEREQGRRYRLPTEAEWELACRAGSYAPFAWGETLSVEHGNFYGRVPNGTASKGSLLRRTTQVGSFTANPWGLYDMHGNVSEWCADWYSAASYHSARATDPWGPAAGWDRVARGGAWSSMPAECRAASRSSEAPVNRENYIGFRVAMDLQNGVTSSARNTQSKRH